MAIRTASCLRRLTHPANTLSVPVPAPSLNTLSQLYCPPVPSPRSPRPAASPPHATSPLFIHRHAKHRHNQPRSAPRHRLQHARIPLLKVSPAHRHLPSRPPSTRDSSLISVTTPKTPSSPRPSLPHRLSQSLHLAPAAHAKRRPLMNPFRLDVQNPAHSIRRHPTRLLRDKRQRIRLIQQPQLTLRRLRRRRIQKHATLQQRPMKIRHQAPDISRAVLPPARPPAAPSI